VGNRHHMFTRLPEGQVSLRDAAVLVVGTGPAGLALARALRDRGVPVVMLESGGGEARADDLNGASSSELPFAGARDGRVRGFGGTGEVWAGQCLPLDDIDFTARPWVPGSGWPLGPDDLRPWIEAASALYGVSGATFGPTDAEGAPVDLPEADPRELTWRVTHYSPSHRLGSGMRRDVARDEDLTVVLDATVVRLTLSGGRVSGVIARNRAGAEQTFQPSLIVLACGALENARLLLASGVTSPHLGRLQDHPFWLVGEVKTPAPILGRAFQSMVVRGHRIRPRLALAPERQAATRTLNCAANIELDHGDRSAVGALKRLHDAAHERRWPEAYARDLGRVAAHPADVLRELRSRRTGVAAPADRHTRLLLRIQTEQPPVGDSRLTLSDQVDTLGARKVDVRWTVGDAEHRTCAALAEVVCRQLRDGGLGCLELFPWMHDSEKFAAAARDFYHHAGTTRMSRDPADGVVDTDCRVHGVANLYVAGGSVFPSSGYANPTLTIVALAIRLGSHLSSI
jgi:choline dehydrogenase-like flavoprotein